MGGAFIAVADDANTITWNPAGLPRLRRTEFTSTYGDLYTLGIQQAYFGFVRPFSDKIALGLDWSDVGYDDGELGSIFFRHINEEGKIREILGSQAIICCGAWSKKLLNDIPIFPVKGQMLSIQGPKNALKRVIFGF